MDSENLIEKFPSRRPYPSRSGCAPKRIRAPPGTSFCPQSRPPSFRTQALPGRQCEHSVDAPRDVGGPVPQLLGQDMLRRVLICHRAQEPANGAYADGGVLRVGRGPGAAVVLRPGDAYAGGVAVEDDAPG